MTTGGFLLLSVKTNSNWLNLKKDTKWNQQINRNLEIKNSARNGQKLQNNSNNYITPRGAFIYQYL